MTDTPRRIAGIAMHEARKVMLYACRLKHQMKNDQLEQEAFQKQGRGLRIPVMLVSRSWLPLELSIESEAFSDLEIRKSFRAKTSSN